MCSRMVKILESVTLILEAKFENSQGLFLKILSGVILNFSQPHSQNHTSCSLILNSFSKSYILRPHSCLRIWEFSRATLKKIFWGSSKNLKYLSYFWNIFYQFFKIFRGILEKPQKSCPHFCLKFLEFFRASFSKFINLFFKPQPQKFSKFFENPTLNLRSSQTFLKTQPSTSEIVIFQEWELEFSWSETSFYHPSVQLRN